jgi:HD-GYP domain-containing protein (c-di-GMP phosphodiesterase class II)
MGKPLRVLILDDSEDDVLFLERELKKGGFDPFCSRVETPEAMDASFSLSWDVILSDYNMPRFNAFHALSILKRRDVDIPFIIVSGAMGEEAAVAAMKAGAHDYVTKNNLARLPAVVEREINEAKIRGRQKEIEKKLKLSFFDLVETVSRVLDSHDPYTSGHARRVAEYARIVGKEMGVSKDMSDGLYVCGLLHDIGKISIPDSILCKPGKLTKEEWQLIQTHTSRGYEILKDCSLPWPAADVALHHHEQPDGNGYPDGLVAQEISIENRILKVCDTVEAMSTNRPYRIARSKNEVIAELADGRGIRYDAEIADIVLRLLEKDALIAEQVLI